MKATCDYCKGATSEILSRGLHTSKQWVFYGFTVNLGEKNMKNVSYARNGPRKFASAQTTSVSATLRGNYSYARVVRVV
jgi:hypothetical protein